MDNAGNCQAILGFEVFDRMTAAESDTCFRQLGRTAAQNLVKHSHRKGFDREAHQVERQHRVRAHGADVRQSIGGGNRSKCNKIVHNWRDIVHRLGES